MQFLLNCFSWTQFLLFDVLFISFDFASIFDIQFSLLFVWDNLTSKSLAFTHVNFIFPFLSNHWFVILFYNTPSYNIGSLFRSTIFNNESSLEGCLLFYPSWLARAHALFHSISLITQQHFIWISIYLIYNLVN
jgi:hypothetical protein